MGITAQQQIRPGYKQTEVGVIPRDWEVMSLGELGRFKNGINKGKEDFGHGFPFVNLMDVFGIPKLSAGTEFGLVNSSTAERKLYELRIGDILFVRSSVKPEGVGLTTLVPQDLPDTVFSGFLIRFRDNGHLALEFKEHCFWQAGFRSRLVANSTVSANTNINQDALKTLQLAYPPQKKEQRAIARALSDADDLIASLNQLIAKKRGLKQSAMQELLTGKRRLPGFSPEKVRPGYKQTEAGEIPVDWGVGKLGDCLTATPDYGINAAAVPLAEKLPVYIRITDITEYGHFSPEKLVSVEKADTERYFLNEGDLVFARTGASVGKSYLYNPVDGRLVFAGFLIRVRPNPGKLIPGFLASYVMTGRYWNWVTIMSMRSGQPGINSNEYAQLPIPLPTVEEQTAIVTVLSDMDADITTLETRRDKTRALKQGMMQELLTGKTRLI